MDQLLVLSSLDVEQSSCEGNHAVEIAGSYSATVEQGSVPADEGRGT